MKLLKEIGGFIVLSGPLFFLLIYFVIAVVVSIIAARQGAKRGKKRWGLYTALVFFLIMSLSHKWTLICIDCRFRVFF